MPSDDEAWLLADAEDARLALSQATAITDPGSAADLWISRADQAYRWLRNRDSLRAVRISLVPGEPRKEGTSVTTAFNLDDTDQVSFTLTGFDAKGAEVPLPTGFTAAWSLADPDSSGASLAVSDDTMTGTVSGGTPDTNLMLSVVVTNPADNSTLTGAEAIVVQATAAVTVGLVPGTPSPENPPATS